MVIGGLHKQQLGIRGDPQIVGIPKDGAVGLQKISQTPILSGGQGGKGRSHIGKTAYIRIAQGAVLFQTGTGIVPGKGDLGRLIRLPIGKPQDHGNRSVAHRLFLRDLLKDGMAHIKAGADQRQHRPRSGIVRKRTGGRCLPGKDGKGRKGR